MIPAYFNTGKLFEKPSLRTRAMTGNILKILIDAKTPTEEDGQYYVVSICEVYIRAALETIVVQQLTALMDRLGQSRLFTGHEIAAMVELMLIDVDHIMTLYTEHWQL